MMTDSETDLVVSSIKHETTVKHLKLEPGGMLLSVPQSACVGTGDHVKVEDGRAWVICKNGLCQFLPLYAAADTLNLGSQDIQLLIKEITEPGEYDAVQSLAEYHYRGSQLHGRTSCLVARTNNPFYPHIVGYVELATPFYMNKARARILDAPFSVDGINWEHWNKETTRKYIHLMVRIARCVVYPEFRGLGLGHILVKHAAEFAKVRWQSSGYLPFFLEISADMLKFVPFAEKAGMVFIGETQGNLGRVYKDMEYLTRNYDRIKSGQIVSQKSSGIVDQQVARMQRTLALIKSQGVTREDILKRLKKLSKEDVLRDFALFHNIVSLPKPTYMKGLSRPAEHFLIERVRAVEPHSKDSPRLSSMEALTESVRLEDVSLSFTSSVRRTRLTHSIQQSFGISPDKIESMVVRHLSLQIEPGEITLIIGPSGSGKTTLLDFVAAGPAGWKTGLIEGRASWPTNYRPGVLKPPKSHKALIELMPVSDVTTALHLMGLVGLSDAFVYLKRFDELSRGQQYRAMLAMMIGGNHNVWLVDEFCANLDPVTANVVSQKLQSLARKLGATVIAAAPHCENFVSSLAPDKIVLLTTAWEHRVLQNGDLSGNKGFKRLERFPLLSLRLQPRFLGAVLGGQKRSTIRRGLRKVEMGPLLLEGGAESLLVHVTKVTHKRFKELSDEDAKIDGYPDSSTLREELLSLYPNLRERSPMTIIEFKMATQSFSLANNK